MQISIYNFCNNKGNNKFVQIRSQRAVTPPLDVHFSPLGLLRDLHCSLLFLFPRRKSCCFHRGKGAMWEEQGATGAYVHKKLELEMNCWVYAALTSENVQRLDLPGFAVRGGGLQLFVCFPLRFICTGGAHNNRAVRTRIFIAPVSRCRVFDPESISPRAHTRAAKICVEFPLQVQASSSWSLRAFWAFQHRHTFELNVDKDGCVKKIT